MIPPAFDYAVPKTLAEAVSLLAKDPDAKILSGGHSLIPMMRFRLASPSLVVDINRLDGLSYVREDGDWLLIGGLTREAELEHAELVRKKYPLLADTTRVVADPLVRNRATIGGNLAHADPANDHPATMLAYQAEIVVTGPKGKRVIPAADFFVGAFETAMSHEEILTEIRLPAAQRGAGGAYLKLERKVGDYATAAVAVQLTVDVQGAVSSAGIGLTNVGLTPIEAAEAGKSLLGKAPDEAAIKEAARLASEAAEPLEDQRGSEEYKRSLVKTLTARAIRRAVERTQGGGA